MGAENPSALYLELFLVILIIYSLFLSKGTITAVSYISILITPFNYL